MIVRLSPDAADQLREMPVRAEGRVRRALRVLAVVPHSGRRYVGNDPRGLMYKVVRIRRSWSYRVIYSVEDYGIHVRLIVPTWLEPREP